MKSGSDLHLLLDVEMIASYRLLFLVDLSFLSLAGIFLFEYRWKTLVMVDARATRI